MAAIGPRRGIFLKAETVWTNSGTLWDAWLLSLEGRRVADLEAEGGLAMATTQISEVACPRTRDFAA